MNPTNIGWCDRSWNPFVGCTMRCDYCYAPRHAKRQKCELCKGFTPHLHMSRLNDPELRRKTPLQVFLGSMGELFDPKLMTVVLTNGEVEFMPKAVIVPFVLKNLTRFPQHTFIILTKRPDLAKKYAFPPNVWLLTSVEKQEAADKRIPQLLECKASVLGVSYEPAHGPVDWSFLRFCPCGLKDPFYKAPEQHHAACTRAPCINWFIIGAESGNRKGKVTPKREWIQSAIDQARAAGAAVFVKRNIWEKLYPEFEGIEECPDLPQRHRGLQTRLPADTEKGL